jgi:hypothetical protein
MLSACSTALQRNDAIAKLLNAAAWAADAARWQRAGQIKAAFERWALVYNHDFPAYGLL